MVGEEWNGAPQGTTHPAVAPRRRDATRQETHVTAGDPITPVVPVDPVDVAPRPPAAHLRLVEGHDHEWHLRSIDFNDGVSVREFGCDSCDSVWFD